eukprot:7311989-Alexandrium_andersonii.AAC.1
MVVSSVSKKSIRSCNRNLGRNWSRPRRVRCPCRGLRLASEDGHVVDPWTSHVAFSDSCVQAYTGVCNADMNRVVGAPHA